MFEIPELGFEIQEIVNGNTRYLDELIELYLQLFPGYGRYVAVMRRRANRPNDVVAPFLEHQWLALVNGRPAAMTVFKYNYKRNCGLGLDLGVHPDYRNFSYSGYTSLARLMIELRHKQLLMDAKLLGKPLPLGSLVEVESPKVVARFKEYGMLLLPVKYYEPPAPEEALEIISRHELEKTGFNPMHLGIYPIDRDAYNPKDVDQISMCVKAYLMDHYGLSETHWAVQESLQSISIEESAK